MRRTTAKMRLALAINLVLVVAVAHASAQTSLPAIPSRVDSRPALCPVTGAPISYDHRTRFRGRRVYFATPAALQRFEADPYAFGDGLKRQWEALRPLRTQVRCPVSDDPVRMDVYVEQRTSDVYFSDDREKQAWLAAPDRYAERLESCYVFQTTCVVCDNSPLADVSQTVGRRVVYFCCPGCRAAMDTDRAVFMKGLDQELRRNRQAWEQLSRSPTSARQEP